MAMVDLLPPLYEPKSTDEYFTPKPGEEGVLASDVQPVNLNAITYYALIGMKPKRIAVLVGTNHNTIWKNNRMRQAYENGAAYHEAWLRGVAMEATKYRPAMALEMLNRVAGSPDQDIIDGTSPDDLANSTIEFTVSSPTVIKPKTLTKSEREELEADDEA